MSYPTIMRSLFVALCTIILLTGIANAAELDLTSAKRAGLVGEKPDGLIAALLPNPSADVADLVSRTNQGRLGVYRATAVKENIPVSEVQKIAADKIFNMSASGEYLMIGGQWVQKK